MVLLFKSSTKSSTCVPQATSCAQARTSSGPHHRIDKILSLHGLPAHSLAHIAILFPLEKLSLLIRGHALELALAVLLLLLVGGTLALLGLLGVLDLLEFLVLVVAGGADAAHDFGAEMAGRDERVGEAEEAGQEGQIGRVGWVVEAEGQLEALLWEKVVEAVVGEWY